MRNVDTNQSCHNLRCFVAKYFLIKFTLFCHKICSVAVYALLRGEKTNQTLHCACGEKGQISGMIKLRHPHPPSLREALYFTAIESLKKFFIAVKCVKSQNHTPLYTINYVDDV